MNNAEIAETLVKARDLLVTKGWIKNSAYSDDGFCTLGAVGAVAKSDLICQASCRALSHHLNDGMTVSDLLFFNDDIKTTKQDVLDVFEKTIADLGGMA